LVIESRARNSTSACSTFFSRASARKVSILTKLKKEKREQVNVE
jgi:hypothetical protein